jgi:Ca-activated chloride channel family protein
MKYLLLVALLMITNDDARRANEAYQKGDYPAAEQLYLQAIQQNPDDARLYFNLGNALAQQGKFNEAASAFERFKDQTDDPIEKAKADYNLGNIFGNQQKWDRAAEQYRQALRQNPHDPDAKYNFELSNRMLEQQQQQQQSNDQQQNQDGEQDQQSQSEQGNEDQQNDQNQQNQQNQQDQQSGNEQQQQQPRNPNEMSKEEADRILNALDNKEQDLLKNYHKNKIPSTKRNVKNW